MWKFLLDKNFAKPSYLCIAKKFRGENFHQCTKGRHILYAIFNTGQKNVLAKISILYGGYSKQIQLVGHYTPHHH